MSFLTPGCGVSESTTDAFELSCSIAASKRGMSFCVRTLSGTEKAGAEIKIESFEKKSY